MRKKIRSILAWVLATTMATCLLCGPALAATGNTQHPTDPAVEGSIETEQDPSSSRTIDLSDTLSARLAEKRIEEAGRPSRFETESSDGKADPAIAHAATSPVLHLQSVVDYLASDNQREQERNDYVAGGKELALTLPVRAAEGFLRTLALESGSSVKEYVEDTVKGAKIASDKVESLPVIGPMYQNAGTLGRATVLTGAAAVNTMSNGGLGLLLGAVIAVATVVMIPITALASPFLYLQDGPRVIEAILTGFHEVESVLG